MKKFTQFLDAAGLREWLVKKNHNLVPIVESSLSRVFQHIEDDSKSFGIVSAFRGANSKQENLKLHDQLKQKVRAMGYGYIEMRGGYVEKDANGVAGSTVEELSLLVPQIKKTEIIKLGKLYQQDSVMYKDAQDFYYIGTSEVHGVGTVTQHFRKGEGQHNLELAKHKVMDYFSKLKKGSHMDKKFLFKDKPTPTNDTQNDKHSDSTESSAKGHRPGDVWKTTSGVWGAMDSSGNYEYHEDQESAKKYAKKHRKGYTVQEQEEWSFSKAAYLRRGELPKWLTIYEQDSENSDTQNS